MQPEITCTERLLVNAPRYREISCAVLIDKLGRLLLQQRDDKPNIVQPKKVGLFGGHREAGESYLQCVVREVHEEIGVYVPSDCFEQLECFEGPDPEVLYGRVHAELYMARNIPAENMVISEGALLIVQPDEIYKIESKLTPFARMALGGFV